MLESLQLPADARVVLGDAARRRIAAGDPRQIDRELLEFTRRLSRLRAAHPIFRRRHFFQGRRIRGSELEDITWLRPDGHEMTESEWNTRFTRSFGMRLGGDAILEWDEHGRRVTDDTFLILFNADANPVKFTMPSATRKIVWSLVLSTDAPRLQEGAWTARAGAEISLAGRSVVVLKRGEAE